MSDHIIPNELAMELLLEETKTKMNFLEDQLGIITTRLNKVEKAHTDLQARHDDVMYILYFDYLHGVRYKPHQPYSPRYRPSPKAGLLDIEEDIPINIIYDLTDPRLSPSPQPSTSISDHNHNSSHPAEEPVDTTEISCHSIFQDTDPQESSQLLTDPIFDTTFHLDFTTYTYSEDVLDPEFEPFFS